LCYKRISDESRRHVEQNQRKNYEFEYIHPHTRTHAPTHIHPHTRTHTHTPTHTRTHTHTPTHTHGIMLMKLKDFMNIMAE